MSRSGLSEYEAASQEEQWAFIRFRGAVNSAIKGKRGQAFLRELLAAMDAMPEKKLIAHDLEAGGQFCALGVVGHARGIDMAKINADEPDEVAQAFGIAEAMCQEIAYMNDDGYYHNEPPEQRFRRMRAWVEKKIVEQE